MGEQPGGGIPWDPVRFLQTMAPAAARVASQVAGPLTASAADLSLVVARTTLQVLLGAGRWRLVGRTLAFGHGDRQVSVTITGVDFDSDPLLAAVGQAGTVTVEGTDLAWHNHRFSEARVVLHNVHTRPGTHPLLVAAPLDLFVTVSSDGMAQLVAERAPRVELEITRDARMRARWARRPMWGWVEVEPSAEGRRVLLRPVGLGTSRRDWRFERELPAVNFTVDLPDSARICGFELRERALVVQVRVDEWRLDYLDSLSFLWKPGES